MAFNDTLFQLGMDLTRSSTAQKEDHVYDVACVARSESEQESTHNETRSTASNAASSAPNNAPSNGGRHLFIDLHGAGRLTDAKSAERALKSALESLGKTVKSVRVSRVVGGTALSGVAVLSVGHLSFTGNPATGSAAIDLRGCCELDSHAALFALAESFAAREAVIQKLRHSDVVFLPAAKVPAKVRTKAPKSQRKAA